MTATPNPDYPKMFGMGLNFVGMAPYCKKTGRQRNLQENSLVRFVGENAEKSPLCP